MDEKKQEILKQLERGEISAEHAFALLSQMSSAQTTEDASPQTTSNNHTNETNNMPLPHNDHNSQSYAQTESWSVPPNNENVDFDSDANFDWIDSIVGWVPGVVEEITDSLSQFNIGASITEIIDGTYGHFRKTATFTSDPISQEIEKITFIGKNAEVTVHGYDGNTIHIQCIYNARHPNDEVVFSQENGVFQVMYDEKRMRSVEIHCDVPRTMIKTAQIASKNAMVSVANIIATDISLYSKNDKIFVEEVSCTNLAVQNRNSQIKLKNVLATQNITLDTTNDKIALAEVKAHNVQLATKNNGFKLSSIDVENLRLSTTNNSIKLNKLFDYYSNWTGLRTLDVKTTNSTVLFHLPPTVALDMVINAPRSKISCKRDDIYFSENDHGYVIGKNREHATSTKKLDVRLATTNATVKIR